MTQNIKCRLAFGALGVLDVSAQLRQPRVPRWNACKGHTLGNEAAL